MSSRYEMPDAAYYNNDNAQGTYNSTSANAGGYLPPAPAKRWSPSKDNTEPLPDPQDQPAGRQRRRTRKSSFFQTNQVNVAKRRLGNREILFNDQDDIGLFDEVLSYKEGNPNSTVMDAWRDFAERHNGDAIVKIVYADENTHYDAILTFKGSDKLPEYKRHEYVREIFESVMVLEDLIIEREKGYNDIVFLKVMLPFVRACDEAEHMEMRFPVHDDGDLKRTESHNLLGTIPIQVPEALQGANQAIQDYGDGLMFVKLNTDKVPFKANKLHSFKNAGPEKPLHLVQQAFFTNAQKNLMTHNIIQRLKIDYQAEKDKNKTKRGLNTLLKDGVYNSYYAVHDGSAATKKGEKNDNWNDRNKLMKSWVKRWYTKQPLEEIRDYFGEKVAFYFSWLGFYTMWLISPAVIGFIVFIYGISLYAAIPKGGDDDIIKVYYQSYMAAAPENRGYVLLQAVFDNDMTIYFALFMCIWSTLFLEFWKRRNNTLAYNWGVLDYEREEQTRPEWKPSSIQVSAVTLKPEYVYPKERQIRRQLVSAFVIGFYIAAVIGSVACFIIFRAWSKSYFVSTYGPGGSLTATILSALVSVLSITILDILYRQMSVRLNEYENYKTYTQFEDALIMKRYVFEFINFYSSLFYVGIIHIWTGDKVFGREDWLDTCTGGSCMVELFIQMATVFGFKQFFQTFLEVVIPALQIFIPYMIAKRKAKKSSVGDQDDMNDSSDSVLEKKYRALSKNTRGKHPQFMKDYDLSNYDPNSSLNDQYAEMVRQFGFVSLFSCGFPLAPLLAVINNIIEIRSDAYNFLAVQKRPFAYRAQDIGMWEKLLSAVNFISVITNALIIAFASEFFKIRFVSRFGETDTLALQLGFVLVFENVVFAVKLLAMYIIPDVPDNVRDAQEREVYLAKTALSGEKVEEEVVDPDFAPLQETCFC